MKLHFIKMDLEKICETLDKLTLDSLTLMEKHIQNKIDLEQTMLEGKINMAKARYIMGQNKVTRLQLPTEGKGELEALANVHYQNEQLKGEAFDLELRKSSDIEKSINPIKWFGILVPQSLHIAQDKFKHALHFVIKSINVQIQLDETLNAIEKLKNCKERLNQ